MISETGAQEFSFATEIVIKSLVVQVVALSTLWFMRRASAAARHLYLTVTVLIVLALPATTLLLPSFNTGIISLPPSLQKATTTLRVPVGSSEMAAVHEDQAVFGAQSSSEEGRAGLLRALFIAWAVGTGGFLAWVLGGLLYSAWLSSKARSIRDDDLTRLLEEARAQTGIARQISLLETDRVKVPVVYGITRPRLILPSQARTWPRERLRAIFIHELGHIKRHDILFQFLAKLSCCLYWFNPLVWITERRLFLASECASDDLAIESHFRPADYAEHLMDTSVELGTDRNPVWATAAMAEGTAFKDRILSILNPNIHRIAPKRAHASALIIGAIAIAIPLAALSLWEIAEDRRDESQENQQTQVAQVTQTESSEYIDETDESLTSSDHGDADADFRAWRQALEVDDASVREHAATALGKRGDRRVVPDLIKLLDDPSASVREHTASALGNLGDNRALDALVRTMRRDSSVEVREHAASALGNLGDRRAYEPLLETLKNDGEPRVRAHAAYGLGLLGDGRAVGPLVEALQNRNHIIRWHAAMALGELGDRLALDALADALKDPAEEVRREAKIARSKILEE
jgi:HEAT repeat protein